MKALIISDIHGSHEALKKVLDTPYQYDLILLAGDHMYHGPRNPILPDYDPSKVAEMLNANAYPKVGVRGNCDSEVDQMLLDHMMMQDYSVIEVNDKVVYLTHGHLHTPKEHALETNADIYISGHTHLPSIDLIEGVLVMNPGSIAMPKGDNPPTYGYLTKDKLTIYTLEHKEYKTASID